MSWRNKLQPGSFRGVKFYTDDHSLTGGRRLALHEYPGRDQPYAEDLGRKARQLNLECYVLGDNYMADRDALINALEKQGPGNLIHPYLGAQNVAVQGFRLSESTRTGGVAVFSITYVEAGRLAYPNAASNTVATVEAAANTANKVAADNFAAQYDVTGLQQGLLTESQTELTRTLSGLEKQVGTVTANVASQIRIPYNMAALIQGSVATLKAKVAEPISALALYKDLFNAGNASPGVASTTPSRTRQNKNTAALHQFVQRTGVIEAARTLSQLNYASRNDAVDVADQLMNQFDVQVEAVSPTGQPINDAVLRALAALRIAAHNDINRRGLQLPNISQYTPLMTLPALVVAHQLYGNANKEQDIINRNNIRHPGFVPGGQPLEVLNA